MFPFLYSVCCCGEFVQVVLLRAFSVICYGHENQNINTSGKHLVEFYFTKYFNVTGANTILFTQSEKITLCKIPIVDDINYQAAYPYLKHILKLLIILLRRARSKKIV